jgi:hypothetical protein
MKVSPDLYRRSTEFLKIAEQLKADVEQLRHEKQTAFESQPEACRNSQQGFSLEEDIALLEDLHDALESVLHQMHDLSTSET